MKYIYVLTSSFKDLYYEQFFLSVASLRLHNPNAHIAVLTDIKTKESLTGKRSGYEQYVSEIIVIDPPQEFSQKEVSRWLKTSIKKYISGDFLYIDCDTIIAENLEYNFPQEINIGTVLDTHAFLSKHHLARYFNKVDKKLKFSSSFETGIHFNSGVIFCRDTPQTGDFFSRWHSLWLFSRQNGFKQDQPAFNHANYEKGSLITELGGEWNCQITHNGLPFLHNAKIIHYYATGLNYINCPFLPGSNAILASVKETGIISPQIMEMLKNPKAAFEKGSRIICGVAELDVVNSKFFSLLLRIRRKKPKLFKSLNSFIIRLFSR